LTFQRPFELTLQSSAAKSYADDFCREFSKEIKKHQMLPNDDKKHRNRSFAMPMLKLLPL
jgi:hypothetical protein